MSLRQSPDNSMVKSAIAMNIGTSQARKTLEDYAEVNALYLGDGSLLQVGIVADGMGGIEGGEIASQTAVEAALHALSEGESLSDLPQLLRHALEASQTEVLAKREQLGFSRMGTTATLAVITFDNRLYLAHIGDSRAYLVRGTDIWQITLDHSWGKEQLRAGRMTAEEVRSHERSDALARYIGSPRGANIDMGIWLDENAGEDEAYENQGMQLYPGDAVVVCSDGLIKKQRRSEEHFVEESEIVQIVNGFTPQDAARGLVALAVSRETDDNVSIALLTINEIEEPKESLPDPVPDVVAPPVMNGSPSVSARLAERALNPDIFQKASDAVKPSQPAQDRRNTMPLIIGGALVAVATIVGGILLLLNYSGDNTSRIEIVDLQGSMHSDESLLNEGDVLPIDGHHVVRTDTQSSAVLHLEKDAVTLYLGEDTTIWLDPAEEGKDYLTRVNLQSGQMVAQISGTTPARTFQIFGGVEHPRVESSDALIGIIHSGDDFITACLGNACNLYAENTQVEDFLCQQLTTTGGEYGGQSIIAQGADWQGIVGSNLQEIVNYCPSQPVTITDFSIEITPLAGLSKYEYQAGREIVFRWDVESGQAVRIEKTGSDPITIDPAVPSGSIRLTMGAFGVGRHEFSLVAEQAGRTENQAQSNSQVIMTYPRCTVDLQEAVIPQTDPGEEGSPLPEAVETDVFVTGRTPDSSWLWIIYNFTEDRGAAQQGFVPNDIIIECDGILWSNIPAGQGISTVGLDELLP